MTLVIPTSPRQGYGEEKKEEFEAPCPEGRGFMVPLDRALAGLAWHAPVRRLPSFPGPAQRNVEGRSYSVNALLELHVLAELFDDIFGLTQDQSYRLQTFIG